MGGAEEYATPPGAHNELVATGLPDACLVRSALSPLSTVVAQSATAFYTPLSWFPALGTCDQTLTAGPGNAEHRHFSGQLSKPGYLVLRLRDYPAWKIVVNGQRVFQRPHRADGLLTVPVPAGALRLSVDWTDTPDVLLGRILSCLSVCIALGLFWVSRNNSEEAEPVQNSMPELCQTT